MKTGLELISAERDRQIAIGWTPEHDSTHKPGLLRFAADWLLSVIRSNSRYPTPRKEPWVEEFVRKHDDRLRAGKETEIEALIVAGALIAAEIDRLQAT